MWQHDGWVPVTSSVWKPPALCSMAESWALSWAPEEGPGHSWWVEQGRVSPGWCISYLFPPGLPCGQQKPGVGSHCGMFNIVNDSHHRPESPMVPEPTIKSRFTCCWVFLPYCFLIFNPPDTSDTALLSSRGTRRKFCFCPPFGFLAF